MTFIIILLLTTLLVRLAYAEFRDGYHPLILYLTIWGVGIGLATLPLVEYTPISRSGWLAVGLSMAAFFSGALTFAWGSSAGRITPQKPSLMDPALIAKVLTVSTLLGAIGAILQARFLDASFGLDAYLLDPVRARRLHTHIPVWGYFDLLNVFNVAAVSVYWQQTKRLRWWMLATLAICVFSALLTTDRTRFFIMIIWAELAAGSINSKRGLLRIGAVVAVLLAFFAVVGQHFERSYVDRFPDYIHFPASIEAMADPYIYYTSSFPALGQLTEERPDLTLGKTSFAPLVHVASILMDIEQVPLQGAFCYIPMEVNTYTYLRQFYSDFGWFGILLGPYLCGLLASWADRRRRLEPSLGWTMLASLIGYCCLISTFENLFIQEAIWFLAALCVGLALAERRLRNRVLQSSS